MRLGIDLGGTKIEGVVLDDTGAEHARRRVPTPRDDYDATVSEVIALVRALESEAGGEASLGVGHPGAISPATGLIKSANSTWLNGRPIGRDLPERLGRPVRFANDANCFALSEAVDGAGAGLSVVFGVIVGTGTGGGVVANGQVLEGPNAITGEWGHNPLPWPADDDRPGPAGYCGKQGCIETLLSGPGLARDHEARTGERLTAEIVAERAGEGDVDAVESLELYVDRMARSLASVINLLDPDVIVLGGGMLNLEILYESVPTRWGTYVLSDRVDTPLRRAVHGGSGGVRGAGGSDPLPDADLIRRGLWSSAILLASRSSVCAVAASVIGTAGRPSICRHSA